MFQSTPRSRPSSAVMSDDTEGSRREDQRRREAEYRAIVDAGLRPVDGLVGWAPDHGDDPETYRRAREFEREHWPEEEWDWDEDVLADAAVVERNVTITPAKAAEWLRQARSVAGRNRPRWIAEYVPIMREGRWLDPDDYDRDVRPGGERRVEPITFDHTGHVRFGLQRLEAVVKSGATIRAHVAYWPKWPVTAGEYQSGQGSHPGKAGYMMGRPYAHVDTAGAR
jgi:hypothetical protein